MNGLSVNIIKGHDSDCSNNGMSSNHTRAVIYGESVKDGNIDKSYNTLLNEKLYILPNPHRPDLFYASPKPDEFLMFGGNFVYSSDSRFPSDQPIKIHDRIEQGTGRRLSFIEIISITDPLHLSWEILNSEEEYKPAADLISRKISKIGQEYQDVLNIDQRKRVFEGPEK